MAVEAERGVAVVGCCLAGLFVKIIATGTGFDAGETSGACRVGLWVECNAFEGLDAVVAGEAVRVEALRCGADYAAFDGESAGRALGCCAAGGWRPV